MVPSDFEKQVSGYGLTTAQILYRVQIIAGCCRRIFGRTTICFRIFLSCSASLPFGRRSWRPLAFGAGGASKADQAGRAARHGRGISSASSQAAIAKRN